jgi:hypothetical protein
MEGGMKMKKKFEFDWFFNNNMRGSFREFAITPKLFFVWDTQFSTGYKFKGETNYGFNELVIGIEWLSHTAMISFSFRTNKFYNQ